MNGNGDIKEYAIGEIMSLTEAQIEFLLSLLLNSAE